MQLHSWPLLLEDWIYVVLVLEEWRYVTWVQIEGHFTGNGNPTWRATHEAASYTAPAVMVSRNKQAALLLRLTV